MKSLCIKTNNENLKNYLLKNLKLMELENSIYSNYRFKKFDNIIIHYLGDDEDYFIEEISYCLANAVIDIYERSIIRNIIKSNYFYFTNIEQRQIAEKCIDEVKLETIFNRINSIALSFYRYFKDNKSVIFEGFINFRLNQYIKFLDSIIDISVNKFIIDREYLEFIELLKTYIQSKPIGANTLHLVYNNQASMVLDENKNLIEPDGEIFKHTYLSDISFSSNDYALNILLTIIPKKLIIHTEDEDDEFINTLKLIFENRVVISKEDKVLIKLTNE